MYSMTIIYIYVLEKWAWQGTLFYILIQWDAYVQRMDLNVVRQRERERERERVHSKVCKDGQIGWPDKHIFWFFFLRCKTFQDNFNCTTGEQICLEYIF